MAEIQTVSAVFDLLKVTWEVGKFLKRMKDADRTAFQVGERIERLEQVCQGIHTVLKSRRDDDVAPLDNDAQTVNSIDENVRSCKKALEGLRSKVGGFDAPGSQSILDRFKLAIRSPSISRLSGDLEARIQILTILLTVLQLFDQTATNTRIESRHGQVLQAISHLGAQINDSNQLLKYMMCDGLQSDRRGSSVAPDEIIDETSESFSGEAIESLEECLRTAEDIHERFSERFSSHGQSDNRSERMRRNFVDLEASSPIASATPSNTRATPSTSQMSLSCDSPAHVQQGHGYMDAVADEDEEDDDIWPLEILDNNIEGYIERASRDRDAGNMNQAESNLSQAIQYSLIRERHYEVPFLDRAQMQEEMASLYLKQRKWAEAVTTVHELLRERSPSVVATQSESDEELEISRARLNQLLASIYYERHLANTTAALSHSAEDIETAELHATRAFSKRWKLLRKREDSSEELAAQHKGCIQLLVRILEVRDKTVEANELNKLLVEDGDTSAEQSQAQRDYEVVDRHDILVEAIKSGDAEHVESLLNDENLDLERLCKQGKTFLMHAVEQANDFAVHKLLNTSIGADVDTANAGGLTALHFAAMKQRHEMARYLLQHDADVEPRCAKGHTPVMKAVIAGDVSMVEMFFDYDPAVLQTKGRDAWGLLHYAMHERSIEMTHLLLELAPGLSNAIDQTGKTALHHCAEFEKLEQARALLDNRHGLDVNATDSIDRTPLYMAASKPSTPARERMVRLLLAKGAHVDVGRLPTRIRDYQAFKQHLQRKDSANSRASISSESTHGSASTGASFISRLVGRKKSS